MPLFDYERIKKLNPGEFRVYNYIMAHMDRIPEMNIRDLAETTGVSTTTVLRFCGKTGCEGYTELKYRIKCGLTEQKNKANFDVVPALQFIKDAEQEEAFLKKTEKAAGVIMHAGQVIVSGDDAGAMLARYGVYLLNAAGKAAFLCENGNGDVCPDKAPASVALILSVTGEREEIISLIDRYKAAGVCTVSITNTEECTAARMSDINFSCYMPQIQGKGNGNGCVRISQIPVVYILEKLAAAVQSLL